MNVTRAESLADRSYWDSYWSQVELPVEMTRSPANSATNNAILDVLERYVEPRPEMKVLEVGGAPGQFLAWMARRFGCRCAMLDYSATGCEKARRNFEALGIDLVVHERDLFEDDLNPVGEFDVVYSLGLIEHFEQFGTAIERHAALARPGGLVIIGCPNLRGVNRLLMRLARPTALATHNLTSMDLDRWEFAAVSSGMGTVFAGPVAGFDPRMFTAVERSGLVARAFRAGMWITDRILRWLWPVRRLNSRWFSGYLIAVYRKR
jgi:2-polyprenyl-3-methyl-5-hydroxy-6-metoxy-1,4-benzoquinol methylase